MRYNEDIYNKVFPRQEVKETFETSVETFRPTEQPVAEDEKVIETNTDVTEEGEADGRDGESDTE